MPLPAVKHENILKIVSDTNENENVVKLFNNSNPVASVKRKANIPHKTECIRSLDDIKKIQQYFLNKKKYRDYMMFTLGICTGFRISDLCRLDISDVINDNGKFKESIDIVEKKTGKASSGRDDVCIITEAMKQAITLYLKTRKSWSLSDPLLYSAKPNSNGEHRLAEESGWRVMKTAQRDLGLKYNIGSHSMRKTFANIAACCGGRANIDMNKLLQVQHMLKHSDYKTTMRYLNLNTVFTERARQNVSDFVLGKTQYNDITEALLSDDDSDKLGSIMEALDKIIEAIGD